MNGKEIADKLRVARDLMNNDGTHWVQGVSAVRGLDSNPETEYTKFCSIGAIRYVVSGDPFQSIPDEDYLCEALEPQLDLPEGTFANASGSIIYWNDMHDRVWGDVYEAFTNAALSAEVSP